MKIPPSIPKTVFLLGLASLFTDIAGEGIYSILPLFLTAVSRRRALGFGRDRGRGRIHRFPLKSLLRNLDRPDQKKETPDPLGLRPHHLCRPFIALAQVWPVVLFLRFIDRMGKGIRSSPRDALIADVTSPSNRGVSYGFHSSMDNAGQLAGPFLAGLLLLPVIGLSIRNVIFLSIIPGLTAWLILWGIREKSAAAPARPKALDLRKDWKKLGGNFKLLLGILLVFTLGNSTDAFLMIRLSQVGVSAAHVAMLWGLNGGADGFRPFRRFLFG